MSVSQATGLDVATRALRAAGIVGVGQPVQAEDANEALDTINGMIGQWQVDRTLVYHLAEYAFTGTGALNYGIGPALTNTIIIPYAPDKLEDGCFVRQLVSGSSQPVDWPMQLILSREDYNSIGLKRLTTFSWAVFYERGGTDFNNGLLYPWPLPNASYEVHILVKDILNEFTLAGSINLPREYYEAIVYNAAVRLNISYPDDTMSPMVAKLAKAAMQRIRTGNVAPKTLKMPRSLQGRGMWNIFSGGFTR